MKFLKNKKIIVLFLIIGIGLAQFFILNFQLHTFLKAHEIKDVIAISRQILELIKSDIANLHTKSSDWSSWDDSYNYIQKPNGDFIESNLTNETFTNMNINLIGYYDLNGVLVFGKSMDLALENSKSFPESLSELMKDKGLFFQKDDVEKHDSGIVLLPEGNLLISIRPILDSSSKGPVMGTLVFGRFLTDVDLENLGKRLGVKIQKFAYSDPNLSELALEAKNKMASSSEKNRTYVILEDGSTTHGFGFLMGISHEHTIIIDVKIFRQLHGEGNAFSLILFIFILAGTAIMGFFASI